MKKYFRRPIRGVVIAGALECVYFALRGKLDRSKAVNVMGSTLSSWAGAEAGALIGSIAGPAGALVGGFIGGAIGYNQFNSRFGEEEDEA